MNHDPRTFYVYEQVMRWLKTGGPNYSELAIPILDKTPPLFNEESFTPNQPVPMRKLVFRRVVHPVTLVPGAVCVKQNSSSPVTIWYDPNWEGYLSINSILQEE